MITQDILKEYLEYNDGNLLWKKVPKRTSSTKVNSIAGCFDGRYIQIRFFGKKYRVHRLIFLYHNGYLPENIDHIDGNPLNNKIENLRAATKSQNNCNRKISQNNTSGIKGISWNKERMKWEVYIDKDHKRYRLGRYVSIDEAKEKLRNFRKEIHGEFHNNG